MRTAADLRILLVDDEPALRELLRVTFEGADVAVSEAASGQEALAELGVEVPDALVLDLRMPGMDGADLCRRLRRDERTSRLPIVVLSGGDAAELQRARQAGADEIVRKPFSPLELLSIVERLTGREARMPMRPRPVASHDEELLLYARDLKHLIDVERAQRLLLTTSFRATVSALAGALESKDVGSARHSQRVRAYAVKLLETIDPGALEHEPGIEHGFLLHDVGKIGIPDAILRKRGLLTRTERLRMQTHTLIGERMLTGIPFLEGEGLRVVRSHHERWDGGGYPDGLSDHAIPLPARIFAVADSLDAMTSHRPYRRALPWEDARAEILAQSSRQFDPQVVEAFLECEDDLRTAHGTRVAAA
ncbi:MAG TPA: HD domain-containing phosphohydrolase [Gaiellaceae bacterium]|nr:HD domain-containing phosphohydrolase [Gaiellaceae bacterium]